MPKISKEDLYQRLKNEDDARACDAISDSACKSVPGNFITLLISQLFSNFADALLNPKITLPWLLQSLQVPMALVTWLVPIRESGSLLPQLAIASFIRQLTIRKWVWVIGAVVQAICIAAMVAVAFSLEGRTAGLTIIAILIVFSLARGFNSVAAKDVLGKTIPKTQRGNISGLAASISGFATLIFAIAIAFVSPGLEQLAVIIALTVASAMMFIAAIFYSQIKEYSGATDGGKNGLLQAIAKFSLLYQDKQFGHFVITRAFLLCSALSAPYYILLASQQKFDISILAIFIGVSGLASLLSAPFWGRLSDRSSKFVLIFSALLVCVNGVCVYVLASWFEHTFNYIWLIPTLFFFLSVGHQGVRLGRKTYLVNLSEGNKRTDYVSVSNTVIGLMLLVFGSIGLLNGLLSTAQLILVYSGLGGIGAISAAFLPKLEQ